MIDESETMKIKQNKTLINLKTKGKINQNAKGKQRERGTVS